MFRLLGHITYTHYLLKETFKKKKNVLVQTKHFSKKINCKINKPKKKIIQMFDSNDFLGGEIFPNGSPPSQIGGNLVFLKLFLVNKF
jgi:hypothetical protein